MSTSFEEARRCPKCKMAGKEGVKTPIPDMPGSSLLNFTCMNTGCKWYQSGWAVQILPDGSIPDPTYDRERSYPKLDLTTQEKGRIQNLLDSIERDQYQS